MRNNLNTDERIRIFETLYNKDYSSILITGCSGLIGINLLKFLDDFLNLYGTNLKLTGIYKNNYPNQFNFNHHVRTIQGNLVDKRFLDAIGDYDLVIHCAGYAQPSIFEKNVEETFLVNTLSTLNLIKRTNKNFLYLSSSEVYSGLEIKNISECMVGLSHVSHPRSPYIEGKKGGEVLTLHSSPEKKITRNIARLSLAYGPGVNLNDTRILNQLVLRGLIENKIYLHDSGDKFRSYCFIDDAILMLMGIALRGNKEIYNVGGTDSLKISEIAKIIANLMNIPFEKNDMPVDTVSPNQVNLSLEKIQSLFNKFQFTTIHYGLQELIKWYTKLLKI